MAVATSTLNPSTGPLAEASELVSSLGALKFATSFSVGSFVKGAAKQVVAKMMQND